MRPKIRITYCFFILFSIWISPLASQEKAYSDSIKTVLQEREQQLSDQKQAIEFEEKSAKEEIDKSEQATDNYLSILGFVSLILAISLAIYVVVWQIKFRNKKKGPI